MINQIKTYLNELGFNSNEVSVYIALTQLGEAKAAQIAKKANLPRTTAISILDKLAKENYLTTNKYRGVTYYWIESPKTLAGILESKLDVANHLNTLLTGLYRSEAHFPFAQVYDTKTGIKQFIAKILAELPKNSTLYTIDSPGAGNYAKIYSENYRKILYQQKTKRGVITNTLVPSGYFKKIPDFKLTEQTINIRELPKEIEFSASVWLTKNMLINFSGNPPFIVAIKHEHIVNSFKSIYDFLWNISQTQK